MFLCLLRILSIFRYVNWFLRKLWWIFRPFYYVFKKRFIKSHVSCFKIFKRNPEMRWDDMRENWSNEFADDCWMNSKFKKISTNIVIFCGWRMKVPFRMVNRKRMKVPFRMVNRKRMKFLDDFKSQENSDYTTAIFCDIIDFCI